MTDYSRESRKKYKTTSARWKLIFSLFLSLVLVFAAFNGFLKLKNFRLSFKTTWDGVSSYIVLVNGKNDYVAAFQTEPKRIALFKIGDSLKSDVDMNSVVKTVSSESGIVISKYIADNSEKEFVKQVEGFTSYITPIKIIFGGYKDLSTNISRYEALSLWWKSKSVRVNESNLVDLTEGSGTKVMGVKNDTLRKSLVPYVENVKILSEENINVTVVNRAQDDSAAILMESFVTSVGGHVTKILGSTDYSEKCIVEGEKSYFRDYLEKTFSCDIVEPAFELNRADNLTIIVGQEFQKSYF